MHMIRYVLQILYRHAVSNRMGVVVCFGPLSYSHRWQALLETLELYRQFGAGVQVFYVRKIIVEVLNLLRVRGLWQNLAPFSMLILGV